MSCCNPIVQPFTNEASVSIPYGPIQQEMFGTRPNVQVYISDGTDYVLSDDGNQVVFTGSAIEIDMGGPGTGFVKVF